MGGKARKRNRLRLITRRSKLRKTRKEEEVKEAEKARKKGGKRI